MFLIVIPRGVYQVPYETVRTGVGFATVPRIQAPHCGQPPAVDGDEPGKYYGYFANQYGEQAVFVYDYRTHEASVWMGDTDWGDAHPVVDGRVEGIILNEPEAAWIRACWLAISKVH